MNERIRELANQAIREVWGNNSYNGAPEFEGYELDQEKFAELIVKKCMSLSDLPNNASGQWDHLSPSEVIGKHFGVEE